MRGGIKLFSIAAASAGAVVLLFSAPTIASADTTNLNAGESINLATLISESLSVQIGDKVFEGFTWDPSAGDTDMAAANVDFKALVNDIGFSLQFQQPLTAYDLDFKDIVFHYTVAVTNSSNLISDLHLSLTGTASGDAYGNVGEDAYANSGDIGQIGHVQAFVFDGAPEYLTDSTNLDSMVSQLWIAKDIQVAGASEGLDDYVSISAIDQTFSQVPEPSTVLLISLGLLGLVAVNRKRKS